MLQSLQSKARPLPAEITDPFDAVSRAAAIETFIDAIPKNSAYNALDRARPPGGWIGGTLYGPFDPDSEAVREKMASNSDPPEEKPSVHKIQRRHSMTTLEGNDMAVIDTQIEIDVVGSPPPALPHADTGDHPEFSHGVRRTKSDDGNMHDLLHTHDKSFHSHVLKLFEEEDGRDTKAADGIAGAERKKASDSESYGFFDPMNSDVENGAPSDNGVVLSIDTSVDGNDSDSAMESNLPSPFSPAQTPVQNSKVSSPFRKPIGGAGPGHLIGEIQAIALMRLATTDADAANEIRQMNSARNKPPPVSLPKKLPGGSLTAGSLMEAIQAKAKARLESRPSSEEVSSPSTAPNTSRSNTVDHNAVEVNPSRNQPQGPNPSPKDTTDNKKDSASGNGASSLLDAIKARASARISAGESETKISADAAKPQTTTKKQPVGEPEKNETPNASTPIESAPPTRSSPTKPMPPKTPANAGNSLMAAIQAKAMARLAAATAQDASTATSSTSPSPSPSKHSSSIVDLKLTTTPTQSHHDGAISNDTHTLQATSDETNGSSTHDQQLNNPKVGLLDSPDAKNKHVEAASNPSSKHSKDSIQNNSKIPSAKVSGNSLMAAIQAKALARLSSKPDT